MVFSHAAIQYNLLQPINGVQSYSHTILQKVRYYVEGTRNEYKLDYTLIHCNPHKYIDRIQYKSLFPLPTCSGGQRHCVDTW
jgi:hypothetical protein